MSGSLSKQRERMKISIIIKERTVGMDEPVIRQNKNKIGIVRINLYGFFIPSIPNKITKKPKSKAKWSPDTERICIVPVSWNAL